MVVAMASPQDIALSYPRVRATRDLDHLPGDYGAPVLGVTLQVLADYFAFVRRMYRRHGPVCRTRSFFEHRVLLLSPDAAEVVLMDRESNFSSLLGWDRLLGRFFPRGLMLRDFEDHRFHRRLMQEAFKKPAMESYLERMNPHVAEAVGGWATGGSIRFYDAVKRLTLDLASLVFLGLELGPEAEKVNRALARAVGGSVALVPAAVPGLAVWRGLRGREHLVAYLSGLLPAKRRGEGRDMFSRLCRARDEDGAALTDSDVVNHMIFMLLAAHDTTTSALATMAYALAKHPDWQERLREESAVLGRDRLAHADLTGLPSLELVFKEALRLYPPVLTIARRTLRETEIGGFRIPANAAVNVDVPFIHRMEEWWTDPDVFDPERFAEPRLEHQRHRFSWIPFGGGAHMCLGMHFAYMTVKAILHQLLLKYRLSVPDGYEMRYRLLPIPKPGDRLPMVLEPLP